MKKKRAKNKHYPVDVFGETYYFKNRDVANATSETLEELRQQFEKGSKMLGIFIFLDVKSKKWINPFVMDTAADAVRAVSNTVNKPGTNLSDFPADFVLYQSGAIDEDDGRLIALPDPTLIIACASLKKLEVQK